jgi:hypothetical protein
MDDRYDSITIQIDQLVAYGLGVGAAQRGFRLHRGSTMQAYFHNITLRRWVVLGNRDVGVMR